MAEEKKGKHAGHGFTHTHIEHHHDGSHTIHHVHESTENKHGMPHHVGPHDVKGAAGAHDEMLDHVMDHTSQPNPGEAAADGGAHGVPAEQAGPAGLPAGGTGAPPTVAPGM